MNIIAGSVQFLGQDPVTETLFLMDPNEVGTFTIVTHEDGNDFKNIIQYTYTWKYTRDNGQC
jgi:hypothetical protein